MYAGRRWGHSLLVRGDNVYTDLVLEGGGTSAGYCRLDRRIEGVLRGVRGLRTRSFVRGRLCRRLFSMGDGVSHSRVGFGLVSQTGDIGTGRVTRRFVGRFRGTRRRGRGRRGMGHSVRLIRGVAGFCPSSISGRCPGVTYND